MTGDRLLTLASAALLLGVLPLVAAHGDEHNDGPMDMGADMHHAPPAPVEDNGAPRSYWSLSEHATLMYWHIGMEILAWMVILPVGGLLVTPSPAFALTWPRCDAEHRPLAPCTAVSVCFPCP